MTPTADIRAAIETALAERRARVEDLERRDAGFSNLRLATVVAALLVGVAGVVVDGRLMAGLGVAALAFVIVVFRHADLLRELERARRAVSFQERRLAVARHEWRGTGSTGERFRDDRHDYAADLDLFGAGSLFELVCAARTWLGESTAAAWLLSPASAAEIRARQSATRELAERLEFRERLWLAAAPEVAKLDPAKLVAWASEPPRFPDRRAVRLGAIVVSLLTITALALRAAGHPWGAYLLGPAFAIHLAFFLKTRHAAAEVTAGIDNVEPALAATHESLAGIEREPFTSAPLSKARERLAGAGAGAGTASASVSVARLHRIAGWLDNLHDFYLAAFVAPVVFWRLHCALALEEWRARNGAVLGDWLAILGELDALAGFAALAETHPDWCWPEVLAGSAGGASPLPVVEATALGHPLLPPDRRVANDLALGAAPAAQLWMVSGSNMSGKSTWLRSIGSAAVMALAGAPVCARAMRLHSLRVVTSLRVVDSLADGASHFLAEVKRLKRALDVAESGAATLVLFDEILHGTNSRERTLGARAITGRLVELGAVGLVTTHDLALVALADELGERAVNVHFADHVEDGRMHFDYRIRPGVLASTNALAVMRSVGIELDFEGEGPR
ncbi:MAG: DNA mismatch repair protein MutS [Deltaproteobacteria bacterium]|nr:DNA mismatch repair protein MutS [Deltaproteobacteria bacterium]